MSTDVISSPRIFKRSRLTWQAYLSISYYAYMLNCLGPLTPFLRDELKLSYTLASFHFSAYALGVIVTGLLLHPLVQRFGSRLMVWVGVWGMAFGALLLITGRTPVLTILGSFLMGLLGVLISALFSTALAEQHGVHRGVAIAESAVIASIFATLAPVAVAFFAGTPLTWRGALGVMALAVPALWLVYRKDALGSASPASPDQDAPPAHSTGALPLRYWLYWVMTLLVEAVEFCILFWAADYLEKVTGLNKADAALGVSAFLGAMLAGRAVVSRLLRRSQEQGLLILSLLIALAGFLLFWLLPAPAAEVMGLFIAGLGVGGLFPIVNSLALASVPGQMVKGSGNITLAVGLAIFSLPLGLGRLADSFGIWAAYGLEVALLALALGLAIITRQKDGPFDG